MKKSLKYFIHLYIIPFFISICSCAHNLKFTTGEVSFDPNHFGRNFVMYKGRAKRKFGYQSKPPYLILAHELIHAHHYSRGFVDESPGKYKTLYGETKEDRKYEIRTVGLGYLRPGDITENMIRNELGLPLRAIYNTIEAP